MPFLPDDVARCRGVGTDEEGWREGCENCARRLAPANGDHVVNMVPPTTISFCCEFRIHGRGKAIVKAQPQNVQASEEPEALSRAVFAPVGRRAVICVNSWAGRQEKPCRVVGETPKRYRIEVDAPTSLPPRNSLLLPGDSRLVPKSAIRFVEA